MFDRIFKKQALLSSLKFKNDFMPYAARFIKEKFMETGKRKLFLLGLCAALIISAGAVALVCCSSGNQAPSSVNEGKRPNYATEADNWNQYAEKYPGFTLFGDRGGTDQNILAALNGWLSAFAVKPDPEYLRQLDDMKERYGETTFHAWEEFRKLHYRQNQLELNPGLNPRHLAKTINNYIGISSSDKPQDYISADTVKTIIYMNSLCAFFEAEKDRLHANGIDSKLHNCRELTTEGKYPELDALIDIQ